MITGTIQRQLRFLPNYGGRQSSLAFSSELAKQVTRGMTDPSLSKACVSGRIHVQED